MGGCENEKIHRIHNPVCCYVPCGIGWNIQLIHFKITLLNWPGTVIAPGRVQFFRSKPKRPQGCPNGQETRRGVAATRNLGGAQFYERATPMQMNHDEGLPRVSFRCSEHIKPKDAFNRGVDCPS
jgi:hypothetical protein